MDYYMKFAVLFLLLFHIPMQLSAQNTGNINGKVISGDKPVPSATVGIQSLNKGTFTNSEGEFSLLDIPPGEYVLSVSAVGFKPHKKNISVEQGKETYLEFDLRISVTELDQVVVTGTLKETSIKESPVKVSWISNEALKKSGSDNLMDAIKYINGLYKQVDCAVCGTSNIRINGMEGPYTSVLIDGMPVMGALASVYGLNGINPNIIESLEIIKGPNSTLYGSQAMGGVVNIITKNPKTAPLFSTQISTNTHSEHNINLSYSPKIDNAETLFSSSFYNSNAFIDENKDGFSDLTQDSRFTFYNKWRWDRGTFEKTSLAVKFYHEDRLGGVKEYSQQLRGSGQVYGESVITDRLEVFGTHDLPFESEKLSVNASFAYHDQDSYYGDYHYVASQQTAFANLIWDKPVSGNSDVLAGFSFQYDILDQTFNQQELPGGSEDRRFVPGVFLQYDKTFSPWIRTLSGIRVDHHNDHKLIYSPRLNLKISPDSHTTVRLNAGTGFRIVNLFTEEHEALTGSRRVVIEESLDPERSINLAFNLNRIIDVGEYSIINTDVDVFYTRFSNQIIPNYDTPNQIIYSNLSGHSVSRGVSVNLAHNFVIPLTYMVGFTVQDVYRFENGTKKDLLFSPNFTAVFNLTYSISDIGLTMDYTGRINGKMKLPEYPDRSDLSNTFTEQNLKLTKSFKNGVQFFMAGMNLFDYTQKNPLVAPQDPFSDEFATDYVFGPIQGRRFLMGISFDIK
ncbi:TonB-dependent receptor [Gracilimonas halophila]|uniref:TonB-dependent receptor plug domain-containing protein n=1 Tax=Gracilimonas halophila TaxID=1834464 RepID=A0ABW5JIW5_9BACT